MHGCIHRLCIILLLFLPNLTTLAGNSNDSLLVPLIVNSISLEGNKTTKDFIILRELTFATGDTINKLRLQRIVERSQQNLMNTSLFNFVTIETGYITNDSINFKVVLTERWYLWPFPIFEIAETNLNTWWRHKDVSRLNYGFFLSKENFRGRKEVVRLLLRFGYSEQYALQYEIPYINKKQTTGITLTGGYSRNHEINYGTIDNKRIFYKDTENYVRTNWFGRVAFKYRKQLYNSHLLEMEYTNASIGDTLTVITNDHFKNNTAQTQFLSLTYQFKHDKRDLVYYPLKGYVFVAEASKTGTGLFRNQGLNLAHAYFTFNHHLQLHNRFYFAYGLKAKYNLLDNPPYYHQRGLGYGDYVRSYEYYVTDGQSYGLAKSNFKYQLVKPHVATLKWIPSEKFNKFSYAFYLNLFADASYVEDELYETANPLANSVQYGWGAGLDYVTYYDMVLRLEYGFNKMLEHGFFVHFVKPI